MMICLIEYTQEKKKSDRVNVTQIDLNIYPYSYINLQRSNLLHDETQMLVEKANYPFRNPYMQTECRKQKERKVLLLMVVEVKKEIT